MLKIKSMTLKNFLSIGNVTQSLTFENNLVLVLGENLDLGGNDNRNGVGKSAIVNALSYGLFGSALTNIRKDNLINATNLKHMLVTIDFESNGVSYRIERGRRPGIFKLIKDGKIDSETDDADSDEFKDSSESQGENRNTQNEIERIIGITHNMFKHIIALNTYVEPFLSLKTNDQREIIEQLLGITKLSEKAEKLKEEIRIIKDNIKEEEFKIVAATEANKRIELNITNLESKSATWEKTKTDKIDSLQSSILEKIEIDVDKEILNHKKKKEIRDLEAEYKSLTKEISVLDKEITEHNRNLVKLTKILSSSKEKICPTCNQEMDKDTHEAVHREYTKQLVELELNLNTKNVKREEVKQLAESVLSIIPTSPKTFYENIEDAYNHKVQLDTLGNSLSAELESINPFTEQIDSLRKDGLQEIKFDTLNDLVKLREHQEFLLKLLTNKDSFIRKRIIDQNLLLLNHRLSYYLLDMGLPHEVKFKSDLEVEISILGKEYDFDNLSRGERTRLILSLSWAFRDVFESMNDKINLLFIDELLDQGLDTAGVESSLAILKKMVRESKRNVYLISHRDELIGRVSDVLKVVKEGGYTSFENNETEM